MGAYTVVGNLGADPQLRWNPNGGAWVTFTICETDRVRDQASGQWRDGASTWWDVRCSGPLAEHVAHSLRKGHRAVVVGHLAEARWSAPDGTPRSRTRLRATAVGPDLKWGVTTFAVRSGDDALGRSQRVDHSTGEVHDARWAVPAPSSPPDDQDDLHDLDADLVAGADAEHDGRLEDELLDDDVPAGVV